MGCRDPAPLEADLPDEAYVARIQVSSPLDRMSPYIRIDLEANNLPDEAYEVLSPSPVCSPACAWAVRMI